MDVTSLLIAAAVGGGIPWLTGLVAARRAPGWLKAGFTVLLNLTSGVLVEVGSSGGYDWQHAALYVIEGYVVATAAHYGLWKPAGVTGSAGVIQRAVPAGLGGRALSGAAGGPRG